MKQRRLYIDALALAHARKSGIGKTVEELVRHLSLLPEVEKKWKIYLVVPLGKAKYLKQYERANVKVKTVYLPARVLGALAFTGLTPFMDIFLGKGVYLFPNYRNWPLLYSRSLTYIYDMGFWLYPETLEPKNRTYLERNIPKWARRADKVITITKQVKQEIEEYLPFARGKTMVVYCGVDRQLFYRRPQAEVDEVRAKYDVPEQRYILFVGNIEPRKNLAVLFDAYQKLPKQLRKQYCLVIVGGDGWLNEPILERIAEARTAGENVYKVEKYVLNNDLPALYSGAALLVHPAIYEGFGMTPLEAIACGIRVVVADIPAIREVLGDEAIYVNPYDADELAEKLARMLRAPGESERSPDAVKNFSWNRAAASLFEQIEQTAIQGYKRPSLRSSIITVLRTIDTRVTVLLEGNSPSIVSATYPNDRYELQVQLYKKLLSSNEGRSGRLRLLSAYKRLKRMIRKRPA